MFTDTSSVFGVELTTLLRREALDGDVQPGAIPLIIQYCLAEVEKRGFEEVGICTWLPLLPRILHHNLTSLS
jgi:hypothetical protein